MRPRKRYYDFDFRACPKYDLGSTNQGFCTNFRVLNLRAPAPLGTGPDQCGATRLGYPGGGRAQPLTPGPMPTYLALAAGDVLTQAAFDQFAEAWSVIALVECSEASGNTKWYDR